MTSRSAAWRHDQDPFVVNESIRRAAVRKNSADPIKLNKPLQRNDDNESIVIYYAFVLPFARWFVRRCPFQGIPVRKPLLGHTISIGRAGLGGGNTCPWPTWGQRSPFSFLRRRWAGAGRSLGVATRSLSDLLAHTITDLDFIASRRRSIKCRHSSLLFTLSRSSSATGAAACYPVRQWQCRTLAKTLDNYGKWLIVEKLPDCEPDVETRANWEWGVCGSARPREELSRIPLCYGENVLENSGDTIVVSRKCVQCPVSSRQMCDILYYGQQPHLQLGMQQARWHVKFWHAAWWCHKYFSYWVLVLIILTHVHRPLLPHYTHSLTVGDIHRTLTSFHCFTNLFITYLCMHFVVIVTVWTLYDILIFIKIVIN